MAKLSEVPFFILEDYLNAQSIYNPTPHSGLYDSKIAGMKNLIVAENSYGFDMFLKTPADGYKKLNLIYAGLETKYSEYDLFSFYLNVYSYGDSGLTIDEFGNYINVSTSASEEYPYGDLYFRVIGVKIYSSVAALKADRYPTGILPGEYAEIHTINLLDPDNHKQFLWDGTYYTYVADVYKLYVDMESAEWIRYVGEPLCKKNTYSDLSVNDILENDYHGCELYFRKDSSFYSFIENYPDYITYGLYDEYNNGCININQEFVFCGNLTTVNSDNGTIQVKYWGYKNYAISALPYNNRTPKLTEFLNTFFDRLYTSQYNLFKYILKLSDPHEVNIDYLYYIAQMHDMTVPSFISEEKKRNFVAALPELMKRKGTYYSLFVIWKILTSTINKLNIFERWNPWPIPGRIIHLTGQPFPSGGEYVSGFPEGSPRETFHDSIYTFNPDYDWNFSFRTGAGVEYLYSIYGYGQAKNFNISTSGSYDITHNFSRLYPFIQIINSNDKVIMTKNINFIDKYKMSVDFGDDFITGTVIVFPAQNDNSLYTYTPSAAESTWVVEHNLSGAFSPYDTIKIPLVQCVDESNNLIIPKEVTFTDNNTATIDFDDDVLGTAIVGVTNKKFYQVQSIPSDYWYVYHNLNTKNIIVQIIDENNKIIYPEYIEIVDKDSVIIWFPNDLLVQGTACIYTYRSDFAPYYIYEPDNYMLSPHYIVEMDLTNEPFGDDYIINKELIDELLLKWEDMRPACKYVHYRELISPITNFTGNWISLYNDTTYKGYLISKCIPKTFNLENKYVYGTDFTYDTNWYFEHNFLNMYPFIQCWDNLLNYIIPNSINFVDAETISINWGENPVAGRLITLCPKNEFNIFERRFLNDDTLDVIHNLKHQYPLVQCVDENNNIIIPTSITFESENNILVDFGEEKTGKIITGVPVFFYSEEITAASDTWTINYNFNSEDIIVQCVNDSNELIIPNTMIITSPNQVQITFFEAMTGKACIYHSKKTKYVHVEESNRYMWTVEHNLNVSYPITQCFDFYGNILTPDYILEYNENITEIFWNKPTRGFTVCNYPENIDWLPKPPEPSPSTTWLYEHNLSSVNSGHYIIQQTDYDDFTSFIAPTAQKIDDDTLFYKVIPASAGYAAGLTGDYELTLTIPLSAGESWLIQHNLDAVGILIQFYDENDFVVFPLTCQILNENEVSASFENEIIPTVVIKKVGMSTIESDVIIDKLDYIKVGYGGSGYWNPYYENDLQFSYPRAHTIEKFEYDDSNYYFIKAIIESDIFNENEIFISNKWLLKHYLDYKYVFIQCWDKNLEAIVPDEQTFLTYQTSSITFGAEYAYGKAIAISPNDYLKYVTTFENETTINVNHSLQTQYPLVQIIDGNESVIYPKNITFTNTNNLSIDFGDDIVSGKIIVAVPKSAYYYTQSTPATEWTITHSLDTKNIYVQVINNNEKINPKKIKILNKDEILVTFPTEMSGKVGVYAAESIEGEFGKDRKITEIGIFDINDNLMFYTNCSYIYKPGNVALVIWYKIAKTILIE